MVKTSPSILNNNAKLGYNISLSNQNSYIHMATRQQHLPKTSQCHITLAITFAKNNIVQKIAGLTNTVTPSCVGKCLGLTFPRPGGSHV